MKNERKLKRGLADLSKFFSGCSEVQSKKRAAAFAIEPPSEDFPADLEVPEYICTSFLDASGDFQPSNLVRLLDHLKSNFEETLLLSIGPSEVRYGAFREALPLPDWKSISEVPPLRFHPAADRMAFAHVPIDQFEAMTQPQMVSGRFSDSMPSSKKAMMVLDSFPVHVSKSDYLEILDHGIFIAQTDLAQIQRTYGLIKFCLARNPALRCSILLTGRKAGSVWEAVYEGLNAIVSQYLGSDLGFLGWNEDEDFEVNPDLLLEKGTSARQRSFMGCLNQTRFRFPAVTVPEIEPRVSRHLISQTTDQDLTTQEFIALSRLGIELRSQRF